jgi:hypothetical protein
MTDVIGLLVAHVVLIAVGICFLLAFGLTEPSWRAFLIALGPALLLGVCLVTMSVIVLLVIGVPFTLWTTLLVSAAWCAAGWLVFRRGPVARAPAARGAQPSRSGARSASVIASRVVLALFGAYALFGVDAQSRLPTVSDDARIWSLKGLTLTYYDSLRPEMFSSPFVTRAHPIYPLLQPVFEAFLFRSVGHPLLRWFHAELWLLAAAAIWTAAYLFSRTGPGSRAMLAWLPMFALLVVTPESLTNLGMGYADVTGSILLAAGAVALGLWMQRGDAGYLAVAAVVLAGAGSTKDEDLIGTIAVLVVAAVALMIRRRPGRLRPFAVAVAVVIAFVAPWRIWVSAHHLSDSVSPPIPRALSPVYFFDRLHDLHLTATAMVSTVLSGFPWLGPAFLSVCIVCLISGTARRTACFYLGSFVAIIAALLWLYTTTPLSLGFLLPTSMNRTVSVFMILAAFAGAHLLCELATVSSPAAVPSAARSPSPAATSPAATSTTAQRR